MPVGFPDYYGGLTLPVTVQEGGTGQTSFPVNSVLIGQGTSGLIASNVGTAGQVLQIPSGGGAPTFQNLAINAGAITGILPIANGGTGTPSPALVAGSNIAISGSWPNQTISLVTSPTLGSGYGQTATPAIIGGTADPAGKHAFLDGFLNVVYPSGASSTDNWSVTDTNGVAVLTVDTGGDKAVKLATPLAVTYGGTGTSSPGLVAGSNISITGSWPDQTIALVASPSITTLDVTITSGSSAIKIHGNATTPTNPALQLWDDTANTERGALALPEAPGNWLITAAAGDIVLRATTGTLRLGTYIYEALNIDQSQNVNVIKKIGSYGGQATAGQGVAPILKNASITGANTTTNITSITPGSNSAYRVAAYAELTAGAPGNATLLVTFKSLLTGSSETIYIAASTSISAAVPISGTVLVPAASGVAVTVTLAPNSGTYDCYATIEQVV